MKKRKPGFSDQLTKILADALPPETPAPAKKKKGALSGVRGLAVGAALFTAGRAAFNARGGSDEPDDIDEEVEDEVPDMEDEEEHPRTRVRQRVHV